MRRKLFSSWLLLLSFSLTALDGCGSGGSPEPTDDITDVTEAITDAYAFSLPLVMMSVTLKNATNTVEPTGTKAPINQLHHAHALANADFREVVTPNVDTLYSQAFIDLKEGPLVFVKPAADRYCSAQFLDAWTNSVGIAGSGGEGNAEQEQVWLLMRNDDTQTEVPPGMRPVRFSSSIGWIIGRTLCKGEEDIPNVQAIQERMRLVPLAYIDKGEWTPPQGTYDSRYDYVPVERVKKMTPAEFFEEANSLMRDNPPVSEDRPMLDRIRSVGVGAGLTFDPVVLGKDAAEREATWKRVVDGLGQRMKQAADKFIVRDGAWEYLGEPIGRVRYGVRLPRDGRPERVWSQSCFRCPLRFRARGFGRQATGDGRTLQAPLRKGSTASNEDGRVLPTSALFYRNRPFLRQIRLGSGTTFSFAPIR